MNKYRAQKVSVGGFNFDSKSEARRWGELKLMQSAHEIENIEVHPRYEIYVAGIHICGYIADFRYLDRRTGDTVIEDVKGVKTPAYILKKKLMRAVHGIEVREVKA